MFNLRRPVFLSLAVLFFAPATGQAQQGEKLILVQTTKSAEQVSQDIDAAAKRYGYGVLAKRNMTKTLASKGQSIDEAVMIFDLCNPRHAKKAIDATVAAATVLPCSIAVWEQDGRTTLAMVKPTRLLGLVTPSKELNELAQQVEEELHLLMKELAKSGKPQ